MDEDGIALFDFIGFFEESESCEALNKTCCCDSGGDAVGDWIGFDPWHRYIC